MVRFCAVIDESLNPVNDQVPRPTTTRSTIASLPIPSRGMVCEESMRPAISDMSSRAAMMSYFRDEVNTKVFVRRN